MDIQAEVEAEQARLQERLREALRLHLIPRTISDETSSPLGQMVDLVDDLLEVRLPVIHSHESLIHACDHTRST